VAVDAGPSTPAGLLGRVVSERVEGDATALGIVPASLVEAVPEGRLAIGPRSLGKASAAAAGHGFRSALSCSGGVGAELGGSLAVTLDPTFELEWSWGEVERAEAAATIRGDASLWARIGAAGSCDLAERSVASWDAPALRLALGPIPVVIVPRTTLYVSGSAEASAAEETGVHGFVSATAGLRYDGELHAIGAFDHDLSWDPPAAVAKAAIGARVTPSVTLLLYGEAGPRFDLSTGLQLEASPGANPWWTLSAPVELRAGLAVPGFPDLGMPQQTVFGASIPVAAAEAGPAPAEQQQPASGEGAERARVAWNTSATDVDLHVWDEHGHHASYTTPGGVPGGHLSEDDRHGFGPELFFDAAGPRALTFGLCYFDDHGSGPTEVTVRLTDPDGTVRESARTLAHKGDSVLLGSSPAGSAFAPAEGWCSP
jgi:hypothetical protein